MGPLLSPLSRTSLLATLSKPRLILTIITLPSLAGTGGVFDTPVEKCPPERGGRLGHVTGVPSSLPFSKNNQSASKVAYSDASPYPSPTTTPTAPIHFKKRQDSNNQLATPPLTPENCVAIPHPQKSSSLAAAVYPDHAVTVSKYTIPLQIAQWDGFVLDLPGKQKTLYVDGRCAQLANLRESVVALLDLASEQLECEALIIVLPRSSQDLDELIHSLMYVGGQVVTRPPFNTSSAYLLIGMEV